jgi:hypothetical protein
MGAGIKSIITTITGIHPIPYEIIWPRGIMGTGQIMALIITGEMATGHQHPII